MTEQDSKMSLTFRDVNIYFLLVDPLSEQTHNHSCVNSQGIYVQFVLVNLTIYKILDFLFFFCRSANTTQVVKALK